MTIVSSHASIRLKLRIEMGIVYVKETTTIPNCKNIAKDCQWVFKTTRKLNPRGGLQLAPLKKVY